MQMPLTVRAVGLVLVVFGAVATPVAQPRPDAAKIKQLLIGSYKLVSYVQYDQSGVERTTNHTAGQISYDAAGRMSAQLMPGDRPPLPAGGTATDAQRAAAAAGYIAYFGRYEIDAERGVVTHHVEGALGQNMLGQAMPRYFEFSPDGQTLYLTVKNGDRVTGRLRWDRYK
jgi:YD repeat-containing protein